MALNPRQISAPLTPAGVKQTIKPRTKAFEATVRTRRQVEVAVAAGLNQQQIAHILGISEETLVRQFYFELSFGKQACTAAVAARLFTIATKGSEKNAVQAGVQWLRLIDKWGDKPQAPAGAPAAGKKEMQAWEAAQALAKEQNEWSGLLTPAQTVQQ